MRAEDLRSLGEGHPDDEAELEGVVEGEPVNGVESGLNDGEEGVDNPVLSSRISITTFELLPLTSRNLRSTTGCHQPCRW